MEFSNELLSVYLPAWLIILLGIIVAFAITYILIPPIVELARTRGLYDIPNGRTSHLKATPYLGGVAVFTGFVISTVVMAGFGFSKDLVYIVAGLIIILFVGLKDDMMAIKPVNKLIGQIAASGIIVILGEIRIDSFHGVFGLYDIPYIPGVLFTIFVLIVIINGFNLIDGIDGLSSGVSILISLTLGIWFLGAGMVQYAVMSFALAASLTAFFYFNVFSRKNKIFLGDAGSLITGLAIGILTICFLKGQTEAIGLWEIHAAPAMAFGLLIIPLFDTLRVFILRISQGRSPLSADRQHIHHHLNDLGYSHLHTTLIIVFSNFLFIILSISLQHLRNLYLIAIQLSLAGILAYLTTWSLRRKREKAFIARMPLAREVEMKSGTSFNTDREEKLPEKRKELYLKKI
ncbi:MAG: undecaprenyl/decaprenyl-phosphate alpha-N-acetylglucosaminyl 1-phosphate transferase [Cyclobacteriaceae bacterium]|nr:undecaprenyl/decaprenyl-phosphate alpha-N-acetylglucosaminyl 1-phosphate transferase [Cyclobacteriaceae bacterium]